MNRRQPTSLVKYTDATSALRILSESTLRWSAPCLFTDPFELDHNTSLNFDSRGLLAACVKYTLGLIFSRDDPKGGSPLIKAIRRWRVEDRFDSEDEAQEVLTELLNSMVLHREPEMLSIMQGWQQYSSELRILCLAESHENVSLWQSNGANHSGVAIRFACGDETSMESPRPLKYTDTKPEITSLAEQMEILMSQGSTKVQESFPDKFLTKSKRNSAEKEWRLLKNDSDTDEDSDPSMWFEDINFFRKEVRSVYFGADIEQKIKHEITSVLRQKYGSVKLYQAAALNNRFELEFERLNP